jgi:hypothetical protein
MDKFYTNSVAVNLVMDMFERLVDVSSNDVIVEPSAGNGAFLDRLASYPNVIATDIMPEKDGIVQCDFLEFVPPETTGTIHVIGNPPFGRNGSLATKFFKKAAEFATTISFILPRSFKKESVMMRLPLGFELVDQIDIPKMSFLVEGKPYDVPCVFQVWKKTTTNRSYQKVVPMGYSVVKKTEEHHCALRRVGGTAGACVVDTEKCNVNCFYFVKFDSDVDVGRLQNMMFEQRDDTVGPRSISKREFTRKINAILEGAC